MSHQLTTDFDYDLPEEMIAQQPIEPRDQSKLLVLDRKDNGISHYHFYDLPEFLQAGDVLVFNDTKVFPARVQARMEGRGVEVFFLRDIGDKRWEVLLRPARKVSVAAQLDLGDGQMAAVQEKRANGVAVIQTSWTHEETLAFLATHGETPLPPYVKNTSITSERYQTVYAKTLGSVAAPTAGFHFTSELLEKIKAKGVHVEFLTLHVGLGTFKPIKSETLEEHVMHPEFVEIEKDVVGRINAAKQQGRRVIAVGTTSARALEGVALLHDGKLPDSGFVGEVNLFITPGFVFKVIDNLLTNFHLPKSTLLVLVSALAGRENILRAYEEAKANKYRFYSFGDAMFIK